MKLKKFACFFLFFPLFLLSLPQPTEAEDQNLDISVWPPVIQVGKVEATWKGFLDLPLWAQTDAYLKTIDQVVLPNDVTSFMFGLIFQGENTIGLSEKCTVKAQIEVESYPHSGEWLPLLEINKDFSCQGHQSLKELLYSQAIFQKQEVARYKITAQSLLPVGPKSKITSICVTVKLSIKTYSTYTSIPFIPLTILHDPSGDRSFTGLKPGASITHLLRLKLGGCMFEAKNQQGVVFEAPEGKLAVKPSAVDNESVELTFQASKEIKSEIESFESSLIGPGFGDVYVVAKNLPVKLNYSKALSYGVESKLHFNIVNDAEAGLDPTNTFELLVLPSAALRSFKDKCPLFGSWKALGIPEEVRNQLMELNIGWDNFVTPEEDYKLLNSGQVYLNPDENTINPWPQSTLQPVRMDLKVQLDPTFCRVASIPIVDHSGRLEVILNKKTVHKSFPPEDMVVKLEDDERKAHLPDFFSYQLYIDRLFGTVLFITKDDKTKPANLTSLHDRSISSHPHEYWTQGYSGNILAKVNIGSPLEEVIQDTGLPIANPTFKQDGQPIMSKKVENRYVLENLSAQEHIISVEAEGFLGISKVVNVPSAKEIEISFNLLPEKPLLYGQVTEAEGKAVAEAKVTVQGEQQVFETLSDQAGYYQVSGLEEGKSYSLRVVAKEKEYATSTKSEILLAVEQKVWEENVVLTKVLAPERKKIAETPKAVEESPEITSPPAALPDKVSPAPEAPPLVVKIPTPPPTPPVTPPAALKKTPLPSVEAPAAVKKVVPSNPSNLSDLSDLSGAAAAPGSRPSALAVAFPAIANPDFSRNLLGWEKLSVGPQGKVQIGVIKESAEYPHVLMVSRKASEVGKTGMYQRLLGVDTSLPTGLKVRVEIKAVSCTLKSDKKGCYPAIIEVWYQDAKNRLQGWRHGFLCGAKELNHPEIGQIVPLNTWVSYTSPDLTKIKPQPKRIAMVRLYGYGRSFEFRVARVELLKDEELTTSLPTEANRVELVTEVAPGSRPSALAAVELPAPEPEKVLPPKPAKPETPAEPGFITNPTFSSKLTGWQMVRNGQGQIYVEVVRESPEHPHVLSITSKASGRIRGEAGVSQKLDLMVAQYPCLRLRAKVKAISCSLSSDGKRGGVYPINLEIEYTDITGQQQVWRHGFLPADKKLNYPEIGRSIPANTWFDYTSEDLSRLEPKPAKITNLRVYGNGWGFESKVAKVEIAIK